MKVHHDALSDVTRYIENHREAGVEAYEPRFESYLRPVRRFKEIGPDAEILEIGTGPGWFPILCKLHGLRCKGLEISPQLIEMARETGRRHGIEPDIELGNLEDYALPDNFYDVVIASSVFEHVEDWRNGVRKVYRTLKPGGALFFESTNKFSFVSCEYKGVPLYGWLPNSWRYGLRRKVHGPDIMKLGIDFHQFTHGCLRREFERAGFGRVLDRVDLAEERYVSTGFRRAVVRVSKRFGPARWSALTFAEATRFVCIK
ncbi:MAG TPA: class I SAM-dependent methyltransferase [Bryobacteraceae bacterium]